MPENHELIQYGIIIESIVFHPTHSSSLEIDRWAACSCAASHRNCTLRSSITSHERKASNHAEPRLLREGMGCVGGNHVNVVLGGVCLSNEIGEEFLLRDSVGQRDLGENEQEEAAEEWLFLLHEGHAR